MRTFLRLRAVRPLIFLVVVAAAFGAFLLAAAPESGAQPPNGFYTHYYDYYPQYGGHLVGEDGIDCEGNPYTWGEYTSYYERGQYDCDL